MYKAFMGAVRPSIDATLQFWMVAIIIAIIVMMTSNYDLIAVNCN